MEVNNDQWRRLDEVVDAVLAMPPDAVKEEDSPTEESEESNHSDN